MQWQIRAQLSDYFYTNGQASKKRYTQYIALYNGEDSLAKERPLSQLDDNLPNFT